MEYIETLNPIDGRYKKEIDELYRYFSEKAFFRYRTEVEIKYLISFLDTTKIIKLKQKDKENLLKIPNLSERDYENIKKLEDKTKHDVKALEYFIKSKIMNKKLLSYIHFGLTSEDINNIAYSLMVSDSLEMVIIPQLKEILEVLRKFSNTYKNIPILARTHGQPATPTTFGKEFAVFESRLSKKLQKIKSLSLEAKLNGATGNYNALQVSFPNINWINFSKKFIKSFNNRRLIKLTPNLISTQIESHDSLVELFDYLKQTNSILIGLNQDLWRYISDNWLVQKNIPGEIGSSTMPHKINPIYFENSEGNLGLANSLLNFFSQKLPISRLQRDLSDSTVLRNIGVAFGYSLISYKSLLKGLERISVNKDECKRCLDDNPQVLTEAIQVILKKEGVENSYEKLLEISRGKELSLEDLAIFINNLDIKPSVKRKLLSLKPSNYIGLANKLK